MTPRPAFAPPFWLRHRHAQTLYGALLAPTPRPKWVRQRWVTPDQDFLDVDHVPGMREAPLLVIFHGLEGSTESRYVRTLAHHAAAQGWHVLAPNFRSCSGPPNRMARLYHAGDSAEIDWILSRANQIGGGTSCHAIGISLGGNMLLKWLGEQGAHANRRISSAAAVAAPFDLAIVGDHLSCGFNRLYTRHFLSTLKPKAEKKFHQFPGLFDLEKTLEARTLREFDDHFMAPVHGFSDAQDYWTRCSSKPWLASIRIPTLLLNALDDPFVPQAALPDASLCSMTVFRDFQAHGGHVGFVSGPFPGNLQWMPHHLLAFLSRPSSPSLVLGDRSE